MWVILSRTIANANSDCFMLVIRDVALKRNNRMKKFFKFVHFCMGCFANSDESVVLCLDVTIIPTFVSSCSSLSLPFWPIQLAFRRFRCLLVWS